MILYKIKENFKIDASKCSLSGRKCLEKGTFLQFAKNRWSPQVSYIAQTVRFDEGFKVVGGPRGVLWGILGSKTQKTTKNGSFWAFFDQKWPFWPFHFDLSRPLWIREFLDKRPGRLPPRLRNLSCTPSEQLPPGLSTAFATALRLLGVAYLVSHCAPEVTWHRYGLIWEINQNFTLFYHPQFREIFLRTSVVPSFEPRILGSSITGTSITLRSISGIYLLFRKNYRFFY